MCSILFTYGWYILSKKIKATAISIMNISKTTEEKLLKLYHYIITPFFHLCIHFHNIWIKLARTTEQNIRRPSENAFSRIAPFTKNCKSERKFKQKRSGNYICEKNKLQSNMDLSQAQDNKNSSICFSS